MSSQLAKRCIENDAATPVPEDAGVSRSMSCVSSPDSAKAGRPEQNHAASASPSPTIRTDVERVVIGIILWIARAVKRTRREKVTKLYAVLRESQIKTRTEERYTMKFSRESEGVLTL